MNKARKKLMGVVVSTDNANTLKVRVERKMTHPLYKKIVKSHKSYLVHAEVGAANIGDIVMIEEGKPQSKSKTFYLLKKVK